MFDEQRNAIDSTVAPIVEKLRKPDEVVWLCAPERARCITILFMEKNKVADVKEFERMTGLHGGSGRSVRDSTMWNGMGNRIAQHLDQLMRESQIRPGGPAGSSRGRKPAEMMQLQ